MKFTSVLGGALLLAATTLAAPSPARPLANLNQERAAARIRQFHENRRAAAANASVPDASTDTENWGGAQKSSSGISAIAGSLTIPTVSFPTNAGTPESTEEYFGCAWIGIDGWNGCEGLQQAGAYWEAYGNGEFSYYAFYEWFPAGVQFFSMDVRAGHELSIALEATSTTSGTFTITDETTGDRQSTSMQDQTALCLETAEWIVEENLPTQNLFADFGAVTFNGATFTAEGVEQGVEGADILTLQNNGVTWTECGTSGDTTVTCKYNS